MMIDKDADALLDIERAIHIDDGEREIAKVIRFALSGKLRLSQKYFGRADGLLSHYNPRPPIDRQIAQDLISRRGWPM
jgi:hypothetical protein